MGCLSLIIRCLIPQILFGPAVTGSFCALNRKIRSSGWTRPGVFLKPFILWRSRRCRIKTSAQTRFALPVLAALFALGPSGCRQDMQDQPKFIPLRANGFYADQRSARDPVPGAVARGQLDDDPYFLTGTHGVVLANELPNP